MASMVKAVFWKNKKVFLTGHTGFKGAWLALWLHQMGAQVVGYALQPYTNPSLYNVLELNKKFKSYINDINNYDDLFSAIKESQPEIVIHMAAQALVRYSYDNPLETFQTNVMGTANLLQACRFVSSVKAIVNVTSDKCYENQEREEGYKEFEPMGGYDPYSSSKGCAELVTSAFRRSYFNQMKIGLASARAGNVIGGGDWSLDRLVPDIIRAVSKKEEVVIRNPNAIRPWQHVLEPLSGYLTLAQSLYENPKQYSEGFNFGPVNEDARPVEYLVKQIIKNWDEGASYRVNHSYSGPHEAHFLRLDISKAKSELNWVPTWNLDKTLQHTVSWYRTYLLAPEKSLEKTLEQINDHQRTL